MSSVSDSRPLIVFICIASSADELWSASCGSMTERTHVRIQFSGDLSKRCKIYIYWSRVRIVNGIWVDLNQVSNLTQKRGSTGSSPQRLDNFFAPACFRRIFKCFHCCPLSSISYHIGKITKALGIICDHYSSARKSGRMTKMPGLPTTTAPRSPPPTPKVYLESCNVLLRAVQLISSLYFFQFWVVVVVYCALWW